MDYCDVRARQNDVTVNLNCRGYCLPKSHSITENLLYAAGSKYSFTS